MRLNQPAKSILLILCTVLGSYVIAPAQTGNTGGSSGGTGSGQSGLGSGPAASVPSAGGATFTGNPDANPYEKESIVSGESTNSEKGATNEKLGKHKGKGKKKSSAKPSPSSSPR